MKGFKKFKKALSQVMSIIVLATTLTTTSVNVSATDAAIELIPIIGELNYKNAAYELYVNKNTVPLADDNEGNNDESGNPETADATYIFARAQGKLNNFPVE